MAKILDPLAQSFFITRPTTITKVGLFFSSKDDALPCYIQLRKNTNGVPGPYIVPLSHVVVYPSSVIETSDATLETIISFDGPIYLETGEYSLVVGSDSKNYRIWVSEIDTLDIVSNKRITEQPYVGSLYKSQNASDWSAVQTEDLTFKIYRAVYTTNVTSTVQFTVANEAPEKLLRQDPFEVFPGSSTMRVYHFNHGLTDSAYVTLRGLSDDSLMTGNINYYYGIDATQINGQTFPVSNVTLSTYTVNLPQAVNGNVTSITRFGGVSIVATQDTQYDAIYPTIASVTQGATSIKHSYKGTGLNYSVDSSFTDLVDDDNELPVTKVIAGPTSNTLIMSGADTFVYQLDLTSTDSYTSPLIDTKQAGVVFIKNLVNSPSYGSLNLSGDLVEIANTRTNIFFTAQSSTSGLISLVTGADIINARSLVTGTILEVASATSNMTGQYRIQNVLDNGANVQVYKLSGTFISEAAGNSITITNGTKFIAEEAAYGGSSLVKYITRQVDFVNPSTSFSLRLDAIQPPDTSFKFYYKTKLVGETEILANKEYTEITGISVPTSLNGEYYEVEVQLDNLPQFNAIIFKIVFLSNNSASVPKIQNLRAIAFA